MIRPRTLAYAVLLLTVAGIMSLTLATRPRLDLNVQHDRNPLYVELSDGSVRNAYTVKILNPLRESRDFVLTVEGLPGARLRAVGQEGEGDSLHFVAPPDAVATQRVFVRRPPEAIGGETTEFTFVLQEQGGTGEAGQAATVFRAPRRN
ncbi:MAG: FixG Ig-like domain-containing protein [Acetobacterales bacterium]